MLLFIKQRLATGIFKDYIFSIQERDSNETDKIFILFMEQHNDNVGIDLKEIRYVKVNYIYAAPVAQYLHLRVA
jgi:hypothetical protein